MFGGVITVIECPHCGWFVPDDYDICTSCKKQIYESEISDDLFILIRSLINALHSDKETRNSAVNSLAKIGKPALDYVIKATRSESSLVRRKTCDVLGLIEDKRSVSPLIRLLGDNDRFVRRRAANALIKVGDERAVTPLINKLNDSERKVRSNINRCTC